MTDTVTLRRRIERSGYKYKFLARKMGISPYSLQLKIDNAREFKVSQVEALARLLGLTLKEKEAIFFAKSV